MRPTFLVKRWGSFLASVRVCVNVGQEVLSCKHAELLKMQQQLLLGGAEHEAVAYAHAAVAYACPQCLRTLLLRTLLLRTPVRMLLMIALLHACAIWRCIAPPAV
jgi:hypothetical protein